jgi:hypothetical protein
MFRLCHWKTLQHPNHPWGVLIERLQSANLHPRLIFVKPINDKSVVITDMRGDNHLDLNFRDGHSHDPLNINKAVRVMQAASNALPIFL